MEEQQDQKTAPDKQGTVHNCLFAWPGHMTQIAEKSALMMKYLALSERTF
jgi:hypothetical protein